MWKHCAFPSPPLPVQTALVAACEAIEAEAAAAEHAIANTRTEVAARMIGSFPTKRLGDVAQRVSDAIDPQTQAGPVLYVGLEDLESSTGRLLGRPITEYRTIKSSKTRFAPGDILYGKLRPNLNKVWLATEAGICSTEILVFRFADAAVARYYAQYFLTKAFNDRVLKDVSGQQLPRTSWEKMEVIAVPVPTAAESATIATDLLTLETRISAAQTVIAGAPARKAAAVGAALRGETA